MYLIFKKKILQPFSILLSTWNITQFFFNPRKLLDPKKITPQ